LFDRAAVLVGCALTVLAGCRGMERGGWLYTEPVAVHLPIPEAAAGLPRLELRGNLLYFNGQRMRFYDPLETWTRLLGPPTRRFYDIVEWKHLGIRCSGSAHPDGSMYVAGATVRTAEDRSPDAFSNRIDERGTPFPGVFVFQGVPLFRGGPPLKEVQAALLRTETPLTGLGGHGTLSAEAKMKVHGPDGFELSLSTTLDCPPPPSGQNCAQIIEELEMSASWDSR
jgi:hypothetical protein